MKRQGGTKTGLEWRTPRSSNQIRPLFQRHILM